MIEVHPVGGIFQGLISITASDVRKVLNSWGPGKFDTELFLDGKAFNPQQVTDGVVTGNNVSGATLLPNARGLAGPAYRAFGSDQG